MQRKHFVSVGAPLLPDLSIRKLGTPSAFFVGAMRPSNPRLSFQLKLSGNMKCVGFFIDDGSTDCHALLLKSRDDINGVLTRHQKLSDASADLVTDSRWHEQSGAVARIARVWRRTAGGSGSRLRTFFGHGGQSLGGQNAQSATHFTRKPLRIPMRKVASSANAPVSKHAHSH